MDTEKLSGPMLSVGENGQRITKVWKSIYACRLDEFSQLIIILKGDMCIVDSIPERPEVAA